MDGMKVKVAASREKKQTGDGVVTAIQLYSRENVVCGGRNKKDPS